MNAAAARAARRGGVASWPRWPSNQPQPRQPLDVAQLRFAQRGGLGGDAGCFELAGGRQAVNTFMRKARRVPFSPSLGHTMTTCSHPDTTSHRYTAPAEKRRQGITEGLIRLSVGCEEAGALRAAMAEGLASAERQ